jgi:glycosyltransferase involved in cell wall biosynthesis
MIGKSRVKVLMIGPLPPPIGGMSISHQTLVDALSKRNDVDIEILDVSAIRNEFGTGLSGFFRLSISTITKARRAHVVAVYLATTAVPTLGLFLLMICRFLKRPYLLRKAANLDYRELGWLRGPIAHYVIKSSDLYLAQTRSLVSMAESSGLDNVKWFPSNRPMKVIEDLGGTKVCRRFVFVGQVRKYKGIEDLITAAKYFDDEDDVLIDIYGPVFADVDLSALDTCQRVKYRGILESAKVVEVLSEYDALVLPTRAKSEGYPGAILEGFAAGLPAIATTVGAIPELIDSSNGILVDAGNIASLHQAMRLLVSDARLFNVLRKGVALRRDEFDSSYWCDRYATFCRDIYRQRTQASGDSIS